MTPNYPIFLNQFINDLQIQICKSLKRKGNCIKRGKLLVSEEVEEYLIANFEITKRMQLTNILNYLEIDQNILKDNEDTDPSTKTDFQIKFGNKTVCKFKTRQSNSVTLTKERIPSRIFYWEFKRVVQMGEKIDETGADLDARYEARISEWKERY